MSKDLRDMGLQLFINTMYTCIVLCHCWLIISYVMGAGQSAHWHVAMLYQRVLYKQSSV